MSEAPPAYKEVPGEDLVAELAKMKAMMEQMRMEKERMEMAYLETEAKRKEEEEEAIRKVEMESKLRREKRELNATFQQFHEHDAGLSKLYGGRAFGKRERQLLDKLQASGEIVLLASQGFAQFVQKEEKLPSENFTKGLSMILTNQHVYAVCYDRDLQLNGGFTVENDSTIFHCATLYSFSEPLNLQHTKLLSVILKGYSQKYGPHRLSLWDRVAGGNGLYPLSMSSYYFADLKKFESIIRLIPGIYKNGDWKQLDGFFGMYFNETTMKVSEIPPPSL